MEIIDRVDPPKIKATYSEDLVTQHARMGYTTHDGNYPASNNQLAKIDLQGEASLLPVCCGNKHPTFGMSDGAYLPQLELHLFPEMRRQGIET